MNTRWKIVVEVECTNIGDALDQFENVARRLIYQSISSAKIALKAKLFSSTDDGEIWTQSGPEKVS